jgi:undecaprenyl-diphosphatase
MISLFGLFFIYLFIKRKKEFALLSGLIFSTGYLFVDFFKAYFSRIRPQGLIEITGSSFPSGHATMSMIFAILVTYTTLRHINNKIHKNTLITLVYTISLSIGLSRAYLGVHWASDVLAGFLFGTFYTTFGIVLWKMIKFIVEITKKKHESPLP